MREKEDDLQLMRRLRCCGHVLYHRYNLNGSQNRILLRLKDGPMSQKALMDALRIQSGSLSEVVAKVEHAGYIERRRMEEDKRNFELRLTPSGRQRAEMFEKEQSEQAQQLLEPLDDEQKRQLGELLDILLESWEKTENNDACENRKE